MSNAHRDRFVSSFLEIVRPQLSADYVYYNIIREHYPRLRRELYRLEKNEAWEKILSIRSRLRRFFELSGEYSEGLTVAQIYLLAARGLSMHEEEAWIETKDISWLYILTHNYHEAITHLHRALEILQAPGEVQGESATIGRFYALRYLGVAHQLIASPSLRDFTETERYFDEAMSIVRSLGEDKHPELWARINQNYGNLHLEAGRFKEAERHYRASLQIFSRIDDKEHIAGAAIKVAKACLLQAMVYSEKHVSNNIRMKLYHLINEAETHLIRGWELSMELGWIEGQARCKEHLTKVFELRGELSVALQAAMEALTIYRSIRSLKNISAMEQTVKHLRAKSSTEAEIEAFIVMPMGVADATMQDYHDAVVEVFGNFGLRAKRVDDLISTSKISERIVSLIKGADFVVSDLTHERPNVYYETGMAHALKKKVILTARSGTNIHFDLQDFDIVFYDNIRSLKGKLNVVVEQLKHLDPE